jgi:predicted signal transduction protein with EAL and GGDEF domain
MLSTSGAEAPIDTAPMHQAANFEGLLDAAPDAMLGMDRAGVMRFVNRQTQSLFGLVFALKALTNLSGLGVGIHLDDFGTGYSSISVLRDLPVTGSSST